MMESNKRIIAFATFFVCVASLTLLIVSLLTHNWLVAKPIRKAYLDSEISSSAWSDPNGSSQSSPTTQSNIDGLDMGKYRGRVELGLFEGSKTLNYGFGDRYSSISVKQELIRNPNMMTFGLWLLTVLSVATAILFGLVAALFAVVNTITTPIEVITGIHGLFLWNGLAALFSATACVTWLVQFKTKLQKNVLSDDDTDYGWTSRDRATLGYSYFLVLGAFLLFVINIVLVTIAVRRPWNKRRPRSIQDKNPEGVIMLY